MSLNCSGHRRVAVGLDEPLDAAAAQARATGASQRSSPPSRSWSGSKAGVTTTSAGTRSGWSSAKPQRSCGRPSRRRRAPPARSRGRRARPPGRRRARRSRRRPSGAGRRRPVAARVVGDDAVAAALEHPRAHDHVAARRGQAVQEHDRVPSPPSSPERVTPPRLTVRSPPRGHYPQPRDPRRHRGHVRAGGHRALARAAGGRRLLGRVVRPLPPAHAAAREGGRRARGQGRPRQARHRRQPALSAGLRHPGHPGRQGVQGRPVVAEFIGAQPPAASRASSTRSCPPRPRRSWPPATRTSCAARSSSSPAAPTPPSPSRASCRPRRPRRGAGAARRTSPALRRRGPAARLRLTDDPEVAAAFEALDAGDTERGLDGLIAAIAATDDQDRKDELRRAVVGVLDDARRRAPARARVAAQARRRAVLGAAIAKGGGANGRRAGLEPTPAMRRWSAWRDKPVASSRPLRSHPTQPPLTFARCGSAGRRPHGLGVDGLRQSVGRDGAVVVEPQHRDHVADVGLVLDPARGPPFLSGKTGW